MKKISVIGGGLAGLTAGIYLLENNYDVCIYEKNHCAGGFLTGWMRKNQLIDGCIHWMIGTANDSKINEIWRHIGAIDDNVEIYSPNSFYQIKYNNDTFTMYNDFDMLEAEFYKHSNNDDDRIKELMNAIRLVGKFEIPSTTAYELNNDTRQMMNTLRIIAKVRRFTKITLEEYSKEWNSEIIKYALLHGLVNKHFNVFYFITTLSNFCLKNADIPIGGSKAIADRIVERFKSLGGKIEYNCSVDEIIVNDGHAEAIRVNDRIITSDYVVAACDVHYTMNKLLKLDLKPYQEYDSKKSDFKTYSFVMASYKIKKDVSDTEVATIVKVEPYKLIDQELDYVSIRQYAYDKTMINDGYRTIEVFIETYEDTYEYLKCLSNDEYKALKNKIGLYYLDFLKKYYECNDIELLDVSTPLTYERYMNSYKGTFMPYALGTKAPQVMRSNLIDELDNVVLANQWVMMPGGTCVAITMGKFAAQLIIHKDNK